MYSWITKTNVLVLFMVFSALTYFTSAYTTEYRLIARGEERGGDRGGENRGEEGRYGGENRGEEGRNGGENRGEQGYQGAYHPGQGNVHGSYSDYGRSYSPQARTGAAFGAGAAMEGNQNNEGNVQYVPYQEQQPPNSQPQQTYPYNQQPY